MAEMYSRVNDGKEVQNWAMGIARKAGDSLRTRLSGASTGVYGGSFRHLMRRVLLVIKLF